MIPNFKAWASGEKLMSDVEYINFASETVVLTDTMDCFHIADVELMQSTGLKDKNGVEIFEGDIVILTSKSINYADTYWHKYAEVFQHPNGAYRLRGKGIYETELYSNRKQVTLTGNIYETPELLENDRFCTETDDPDY
ncbi:YopX family protein [Enterococcus avium]|nr:YopX family protein [Enterococcus avium]MDT2449021.1 YopX family protein [Enterococcus avium]